MFYLSPVFSGLHQVVSSLLLHLSVATVKALAQGSNITYHIRSSPSSRRIDVIETNVRLCCSSISAWVNNCDKLKLSEEERKTLDEFTENLNDSLDEGPNTFTSSCHSCS